MSDKLLPHIIEIKERVAGIEEHLKTLNGKTATTIIRVNTLEKDNVVNKMMWSKVIGIFTAISFLSGLFFKFVL